MSRIGVAVVGLGLAVEPHARSLSDLSDQVHVRWAASRSEARTRAFAERHPWPVTTDVDAAISDPAVDVVLLLTPPASHLELARKAFAAGKHVLVEKPLDISLERAAALVEAARAADRALGVVLQYRFREASMRLQALLDSGALGEIAMAALTVHWWRPQSYYDEPGRGTLARDGGGVLMTQAIHALDLFRALVGPVSVTAAHAATTPVHRMETEDYAAALVRLGNGAPGTISATTAFVEGGPDRIEIAGTKGSAILSGGMLEVRFLDGGGERVLAERAVGGGGDPMDFPHEPHRAVIADFLDAVRTGRPPLVHGGEALATQKLIGDILSAGR